MVTYISIYIPAVIGVSSGTEEWISTQVQTLAPYRNPIFCDSPDIEASPRIIRVPLSWEGLGFHFVGPPQVWLNMSRSMLRHQGFGCRLPA